MKASKTATPPAELTPLAHYDALTLQTGEVLVLASLLEQIGELNLDSAQSLSIGALLNGCGAIGRIIVEKIEMIDQHASALSNGGVR